MEPFAQIGISLGGSLVVAAVSFGAIREQVKGTVRAIDRLAAVQTQQKDELDRERGECEGRMTQQCKDAGDSARRCHLRLDKHISPHPGKSNGVPG